MNRKLLYYSFLLLAAVVLLACREERGVRVLKLAHVLDINHPVHKAMAFMAEKVAEKSAGKMRLDLYPGGQLGAERDLIELASDRQSGHD